MRRYLLMVFFIFLAARPLSADPLPVPQNYNLLMETLQDRSRDDLQNMQDSFELRRFCEPSSSPPPEVKRPEPPPPKSLRLRDRPYKKMSPFEVINLQTIFSPFAGVKYLSPRDFMLSSIFTAYLLDEDRNIYNGMQKMLSGPGIKKISDRYTYLGEGFVDLAFFGGLAIFGGKKDKQVAQMGIEAVTLVGLQSQLFLKRLLGVSRPEWKPHIGPDSLNDAMPSGHMATACAAAEVLGEAYRIKWLTYPLAAVVGLSRIEQTAHWPSDVFVGGLMGYLAARQVMTQHEFTPGVEKWTICQWGRYLFHMSSGMLTGNETNPFCLHQDSGTAKNIGILFTKGNLSHRFSAKTSLALGYSVEKKVYNENTINSYDNNALLLGLHHRLGKNAFVSPYLSYRRIEFIEVNQLPDADSFVDSGSQRDYGLKFYQGISGPVFLRLEIRNTKRIYHHFSPMDTEGQSLSLSLLSNPALNGNFSCYAGLENGAYSALDGIFSQDARRALAGFTWEMFRGLEVTSRFSSFTQSYHGAGEMRFHDLECNLKYTFPAQWSIEAGFLSRRVDSAVTPWDYRKSLQSLAITKYF